VIGGYITEYFPWKYNFIALALMMLAGFIFVKITLPETSPEKHYLAGVLLDLGSYSVI
jgi:nucleoside permease NupC